MCECTYNYSQWKTDRERERKFIRKAGIPEGQQRNDHKPWYLGFGFGSVLGKTCSGFCFGSFLLGSGSSHLQSGLLGQPMNHEHAAVAGGGRPDGRGTEVELIARCAGLHVSSLLIVTRQSTWRQQRSPAMAQPTCMSANQRWRRPSVGTSACLLAISVHLHDSSMLLMGWTRSTPRCRLHNSRSMYISTRSSSYSVSLHPHQQQKTPK